VTGTEFNYIDGPSAIWRGFILNWIKLQQQEENLTVSMGKLLTDMRGYGLIVNQKDSNFQYPVKGFLAFYQIELKKDLKRKINITYLE